MSVGKSVRLKRLLGTSGRLLGITLDHPIARGVLPGLENASGALAAVAAGGPDAVTLQKGTAAKLFEPYSGDLALILKSTSYSPYHRTIDSPTATVDEALRLGADAISVGVLVGGERQAEQVEHLAAISREADRAGLPLVAHIYPRGELLEGERLSVENLSYAVRLGAELGVDLIKTEWSGSAETFAQVVEAGSPALVALAGGSPGKEIRDYFQMTADMLTAGGQGVTYGRFVWGDEQPGRVVEALRMLIHEGASVDDATAHVVEHRLDREGSAA
ncbi:fructose-bisphosphate aldolase, class I [Haloactinopolyspora alba]|uniref:Fructose-bisphosphate aldolase, class I n=1 Tax=Haloactinopolyspora alba TaxID=648780 RepID=A0A2P8EF10_9ACTN|nr:fructose-bisphosphate aldolase [Haloactinopolyspora alba]PSL08058.1 fructose-bisphosphate aldolase, class I [Haloactinopolyspora alba]